MKRPAPTHRQVRDLERRARRAERALEATQAMAEVQQVEARAAFCTQGNQLRLQKIRADEAAAEAASAALDAEGYQARLMETAAELARVQKELAGVQADRDRLAADLTHLRGRAARLEDLLAAYRSARLTEPRKKPLLRRLAARLGLLQ